MHVSAGPLRGCEYHFAFSSLLSPMRHLFSQQFRFFCGSSNRVKVAVSVSLKQWINGRNTASSNTTVVFWLVTNCCTAVHAILSLHSVISSVLKLDCLHLLTQQQMYRPMQHMR